ncbi:hypothetical protein A6P39_007065 [Streptomyces sp. FXJ1.172]|nr:hypothetical protein [Streptomyces sp. FXJ1.172]WEO93789.1 hypothetical protein A6P39_007065 [Streptomyces sp. FXJ1.172]
MNLLVTGAAGFVGTEGLAETVAWYREHRGWWEPLKRRGAR